MLPPISIQHEHVWTVVWPTFAALVGTLLVFEEATVKRLPAVTVWHAGAWLVVCLVACIIWAVALLLLWWSIDDVAVYVLCVGLNIMLSTDNLLVFMLILKQAAMPTPHHYRAISHGTLLAILLRICVTVSGELLLQHFSFLQIVLGAFMLVNGARLLCFGDGPDVPEGASEHWAVRGLGALVPLHWGSVGDAYVWRDGDGRLGLTRMAAVVLAIGFTDVAFSADSVSTVLAETTSTALIITSQVLSMLLLRPICFLCTSAFEYADALSSALGGVLVLLGLKVLLGSAGIEVPLWLILALLFTWRLVHLLWTWTTARAGPHARQGASGLASSSRPSGPPAADARRTPGCAPSSSAHGVGGAHPPAREKDSLLPRAVT